VDLTAPRGTLDLLPPDGGRMHALYERAARLAERYGFRYVETPVFEHTELFSRTSGASSDIVRKEMYSFKDRSDRELTLRPEGTAPLMRAYLERVHDLGSPFKGYYLEHMYRYGRPQAGRYREHRQFGVEVFGSASPAADVEVIEVGDRFLRSLGLKRYELQINSIGDGVCRPAYREELIAYFRAHVDELKDEHRERFEENPLRVLDCKDEACRRVSEGAPRIIDRLCEPCREHLDAVLAGLKAAGMDAVVTPTLVRGLDYYTRTAFEFVSEALSQAQATLFGGGRYDGLGELLGGQSTPGIGFGMGLERVLLAMTDEGLARPEDPPLDCYVVIVGEEAASHAAQIVGVLRGRGLSTDRSFEVRPLKAQMRSADRTNARYAVIVGDRESRAGTVTWRRMSDGAESSGGLDEAVAEMLTVGDAP
jgi:histidyl-tRNA synthetase